MMTCTTVPSTCTAVFSTYIIVFSTYIIVFSTCTIIPSTCTAVFSTCTIVPSTYAAISSTYITIPSTCTATSSAYATIPSAYATALPPSRILHSRRRSRRWCPELADGSEVFCNLETRARSPRQSGSLPSASSGQACESEPLDARSRSWAFAKRQPARLLDCEN